MNSNPIQETETKMVWPRFKVFWFSRDNHIGHTERKKEKEADRRRGGKQYEKVDRNRIASSARVAGDRTRWKGIVANLFVVPR